MVRILHPLERRQPQRCLARAASHAATFAAAGLGVGRRRALPPLMRGDRLRLLPRRMTRIDDDRTRVERLSVIVMRDTSAPCGELLDPGDETVLDAELGVVREQGCSI